MDKENQLVSINPKKKKKKKMELEDMKFSTHCIVLQREILILDYFKHKNRFVHSIKGILGMLYD